MLQKKVVAAQFLGLFLLLLQQVQTAKSQGEIHCPDDVHTSALLDAFTWDTDSIDYFVNTASSPHGEHGDEGAFGRSTVYAARTINDVQGHHPELNYGGVSTVVGHHYNGQVDISYAYFPEEHKDRLACTQIWIQNGHIIEGDIVLNTRYKWDANGNLESDEYDAQSAWLHELLHLLGLDHHSSDPDDVLYPYSGPGVVKREMTPEATQRLQTLYHTAYSHGVLLPFVVSLHATVQQASMAGTLAYSYLFPMIQTPKYMDNNNVIENALFELEAKMH